MYNKDMKNTQRRTIHALVTYNSFRFVQGLNGYEGVQVNCSMPVSFLEPTTKDQNIELYKYLLKAAEEEFKYLKNATFEVTSITILGYGENE